MHVFPYNLLDAISKSTVPGGILIWAGIAFLYTGGITSCVSAWLKSAHSCEVASVEKFLGAIALISAGGLWRRSVHIYRNALRDAGIYQEWNHNEPRPWGFLGESQMRPMDDFTAYDYLGSDPLGGESHVQCNICSKWSVFPLLHIDGRNYWERELSITGQSAIHLSRRSGKSLGT